MEINESGQGGHHMKTAKRISLGFHFSAVGMFLIWMDKNGLFALFGAGLMFLGLMINLIGYFGKD